MSTGITAPFFLQHFTDPTTNKPVSGGTVEYYVGGSTNIPKVVYADIALTNSLGNVLTLDAGGYAPQYYMLSGFYKIVLRRANGAIVYTRDYIEGGDGSATGDHKFAINNEDETAGGAGFFQDKVIDSEDIKWETVDVGSGILKTKAKLNSGLVIPVWTILKTTDVTTAPFGLSQLDLEQIWTHHYGVAASEMQTTDPGTGDLSIWYLEGGTYYGDATWVEREYTVGQLILNANHGLYDYMHNLPELPSTQWDYSNYPAGLYVLANDSSDGYLWRMQVVKQYPDPSYNTSSFLKYDSVNKQFVWLNAADLTAKPVGPAGGDLFGTYPNPRVKELTGVPAMLTPSVAGFNWKQSGSWASGAGIGFGFGFVNGVQTRVWMAISQLGELQVSYDEWKSEVYIPDGMPYRNSFTDYDGNTQLYNDVRSKFSGRYAAVSYLEIPGTGKFCWVFGAEGALFGLEAVSTNFYSNGAPKLENMFAWTYNGTDPNTINSNGTVMVFTGNSSTINYAEAADINWNTKTINAHSATVTGTNAASRGVIGGNGCDGSSFMCVGRDSGIVMQSADGKNWTVVNVLSSKFQNGTSMTKTSVNEYTNALPMNTTAGSNPAWGTDGNAWGGMLYANDMWIVVNGKPAPSTINTAWSPFMFSYDKSNWNGYMPTADELAVNYSYSMYKIAYGHGKTFATNSDPYQDYKNQPAIYRLLMDEIPAHRKLVAEKGLDVIGTLSILDLPNASFLGTDENGKIIAVSGSSGNFIRNQATDGTNDAPGNIFLDPSATINIRYEDTGTPANNVNWFSVSKDMLKLQGLDVNNTALIGYQAELTPSALALRGRPGTSYGIYNAAVIMSREQFNWVPNVNGAWYTFFHQDLGGGTAQAQGGYSFPRLRFRISDTDTVSAEMVHKIVDSNGNELTQVNNSTYGKALQIPTTIIAGTPNGQELFNYSAYELKTAIAQDGSGQGNNYGTRGFAFIALSSRLMTKGRMFVPQTGGSYMRFGIYDNQWKLIAKSARTAVFGGIIPFTLNIGYGGVAVAGAQLIGGERYYMAYWCDDTTSNLKFGCITGRNTDSDDPQPQIFLDNQEMPDIMGTSGYRTAFRPWMAVYEA